VRFFETDVLDLGPAKVRFHVLSVSYEKTVFYGGGIKDGFVVIFVVLGFYFCDVCVVVIILFNVFFVVVACCLLLLVVCCCCCSLFVVCCVLVVVLALVL
jgi:hypothetical protein